MAQTLMPGKSPGTTFLWSLDRAYNRAMPPILGNEVTIIGAGPAGLMAAEVLAQGGAGVTTRCRLEAASS